MFLESQSFSFVLINILGSESAEAFFSASLKDAESNQLKMNVCILRNERKHGESSDKMS